MYKPTTLDDYIAESVEKPKEKQEDYSQYFLDFGKFRMSNERPSYTVTDFREDPATLQNFEVVMDYLSNNPSFMDALDPATSRNDDDPVEFLRDDVFRISSAASKAIALSDAPDEVKQAYANLRTKFDESEVFGMKEQLNRIADYGADALFNYENAAYVGAGILGGAASGGAGTVAAYLSRIGAGKTAGQALKLATKVSRLPQTLQKPGAVAAYTGAFGAASDVATQKLETTTGLREEYDPLQTAIASGLSAAGGYGLAKVGAKFLPVEEKASIPAQAFANSLRELVDNPGENFRQSVVNLVQSRVDAPKNFRLAIQEALGEPDPAQKIKELLESEAVRSQTLQNIQDAINGVLKEQSGVSKEATDFENVLASVFEEVVKTSNSTTVIQAGTREMAERAARAIREGQEARAGQPPPAADSEIEIPELRNLVESLGGGDATYEKLVDEAIAAASRGADEQTVKSDLLYRIEKGLSQFTSQYLFGKAAGFLTPYSKISPTAKLLQEKVSTEFALGTDPTKGIFGQQGQKIIQEDFAEAQRDITGSFFREYIRAVLPLSSKKFDVNIEQVNDQLSLAMRGRASDDETINKSALSIKNIYRVAGEQLHREGLIDNVVDNYIPRQWRRSAIEANRDEFSQLLINAGEAGNMTDARRIISEMLDKNNQLASGARGFFFSTTRTFNKITDDSKFEKFLNTDVQQTFFNYMTQAGLALAKRRVFGVKNLSEFEDKWITPIRQEVVSSGGDWAESGRDTRRLADLYKTITGEGAEAAGDVNQFTQLVQRLALLPLATLSSFTEIMLNFGVAGGATIDGFKAAWKMSGAKNKADIDDFLNAHNTGMKTMTEDAHKKLIDDFGLTPEEAWHEMQEFGLVMEQQLESMADRLAGDMVSSSGMQQASNKFFRVTLLDQWTKFVQNVSFQTGKRHISNLVDDVVKHGDAKITRRMQSKLDDLAEFGVGLKGAKAWIDGGRSIEDPFYRQITRGAARYTNQIILQPTRMSGLKPRAHTTPGGSLVFQLMGYPTAFSNNILKRGAKRLIRDKDIAAEKLLPTALAMTAVAGATNYMRTRGEGFKDKTPMEIGFESLVRWGGSGILFDQVYRARKNTEYLGVMGIPLAFMGPTVSDVAGAVGYRSPIRTLGTKVPFYGLGKPILGEETMTEYRRALGKLDRELAGAVTPEDDKKRQFKKGGEVLDVPNAPEEPDQRIDKMTGLPYDEQAGEAFVDVEERSLLGRVQ